MLVESCRPGILGIDQHCISCDIRDKRAVQCIRKQRTAKSLALKFSINRQASHSDCGY